jgi:hypothetical protein
MNSIEPIQRAVLMYALLTAPNFPHRLKNQLEKFVLHSKEPAPEHVTALLEFLRELKIGQTWNCMRDIAGLAATMIEQLETLYAN